MFNILKKIIPSATPEKDIAYDLYLKATELSRDPMLYSDYNVSDTIDGRFDMLTLFVSLFLDRLEQCEGKDHAAVIGQFLFDTMFQDMDQALREKGVGDMGVPRRMKAMLEGFNGRHSRYRIILSNYRRMDTDKKKVKAQMIDAVLKNIYNNDAEYLQYSEKMMNDVLIGWQSKLANMDDQFFLSTKF